MSGTNSLVDVRGLCIVFAGAERPALDGVDLVVERGERVALVGASGSGKSTLALALARLLAPGSLREHSGHVVVAGVDLARASDEDVRRLRGRRVGFVFQDPLASLNPVLRIEDQVLEAVAAHTARDGAASLDAERAGTATRSTARDGAPTGALARAHALLAEAELDPAQVARAFPHQLSGGMRQRVQIAIALAHRPDLLVLDEATTALDTVTQKHVLDTIERLRVRHGFATILVTHDLDVAAARADRVVVLDAGRVVARGGPEVLARAPAVRERARVAAASIVLEARGLAARHATSAGDVIRDVELVLRRGRTTALVGASGAGKSTLVRALARLVAPTRGSVRLVRSDGVACAFEELTGPALRRARADVGVVFQDPGASLDPRWSVRAHLHEALAVRGRASSDATLRDALAEVGLGVEHLDRRAHELSGGERQRACWARAFAAEPSVLLLDEPLSSVDPRTREHLLDVLARRVDAGLAVLLVTHDLGVVEREADEVLVLDHGAIVESGDARAVLAAPRHPATRALVEARPARRA